MGGDRAIDEVVEPVSALVGADMEPTGQVRAHGHRSPPGPAAQEGDQCDGADDKEQHGEVPGGRETASVAPIAATIKSTSST